LKFSIAHSSNISPTRTSPITQSNRIKGFLAILSLSSFFGFCLYLADPSHSHSEHNKERGEFIGSFSEFVFIKPFYSVGNNDTRMINDSHSPMLTFDTCSPPSAPMKLNNPKKRHTSKTTTTTTTNKRRKQCEKEKVDDVSFDNVNDAGISSDSDLEQSLMVNQPLIRPNRSSVNDIPSFVGHHVTPVDTEPTRRTSTSSTCQQILTILSKIESQFLRPLVVSQDRTETMLKNLYKNQLKIQRTLRKQKVNIDL
jgi:hypothetical protein